ncbi:UDP-N-acetylmuramoyl-L-alanine--D-glutamate ligase [Eubacterium sp. 1001713B170207_170306_E7]|uniref:UDP-N-acetylmuramoyl-L-alanine--D-glutamate ligase n=1 Tax=Eubacterium sp. 1001713B170207_170306_E7 TaxID=2787097 RepID=UPI0018995FB0|nr:UDP-N-acetylmuramoyl-L-alanine--D-glutamate ligase [Eubacterium sp. 1001713B170207_170306_E7]
MSEKILVIGAARSGVAVSKLLMDNGKAVVLTDNRPEDVVLAEFPQVRETLAELEEKGIETVFGRQIDTKVINEIDRVVTSPGVPLTIPIITEAYRCGVPVIGEAELAYCMTKAPFVAITGTNGKTTTTTLTGEIFKNSGRRTYTVGNIGDPISNYVTGAAPEDVFVTEISAFQLETINKFRPVASAILNLSPDHMDRYGTMENYIAAKARIFENQRGEDFLVLNADDEQVCELGRQAQCRKYYFSLDKKVAQGAYAMDGGIFINDNESVIPICRVEEMGIKGPHNVQNALAATVLAYFMGVDVVSIAETLKSFGGVEHRQEFVASIGGVDYINDSKGTNTNAAIVALNAMTKPVVLIAGGYDKKEDYSDFIEVVKQKVKRMILVGATAPQIEETAQNQGYYNTVRVGDYDEAVKVASECALPGDVVLLSPACASWDMFDNFEIRGQVFKDLVKRIGSN